MMRHVWTGFLNFIRRDEGQGLAEYGLILALIAAVAVTALSLMGKSIFDLLNNIAGKLKV